MPCLQGKDQIDTSITASLQPTPIFAAEEDPNGVERLAALAAKIQVLSCGPSWWLPAARCVLPLLLLLKSANSNRGAHPET